MLCVVESVMCQLFRVLIPLLCIDRWARCYVDVEGLWAVDLFRTPPADAHQPGFGNPSNLQLVL